MEVMSFHDHWRILSPSGKAELAAKLHSSQSYLSQVAHGHVKPHMRLVDLARLVTGIHLEFEHCCED